jgi:hypothetical protein
VGALGAEPVNARAAGLLLGLGLVACSTAAPPRAVPEPERPEPERPAPVVAVTRSAPRAAICEPAAELEPIALPAHESAAEPSAANLSAWVRTLAGPALRGREAGTTDALRAARSIAERFAALGIQPPDSGGYCRGFEGEGFRDHNVVAHVAPRDPACGWVMLGAHYDALGVDRAGRVFPGADDNASGVALLLEAARLLTREGRAPKVGLSFVAFGGEEKDLSGSRAYVENPTRPLSELALMINVDMVGRRPGGHPGIGFEPSGRERAKTDRLVKSAAGRAGVGVIPMRLGDRSDSASFAPYVATVFFSTAVSADYHRPTDTPERVDYAQVRRAVELVLELVASVECGT